MSDKHYDLVIIGSGPAGEKAAAKAAYFGKKVALVERQSRYGGAGIHTGTLPSKTLKETALVFSEKYSGGLDSDIAPTEHEATVDFFMFRKNRVTDSEGKVVHNNLVLHNVDLYHGVASFQGDHEIRVCNDFKEQTLTTDFVLIATGTYPFQPSNIPFDNKRVHDSDTILGIKTFPKSLAVVGAGVIGCEYATIFATMGTKVFLINNRDKILPFLDLEVANYLVNEMSNAGVDICFNTSIEKMTVPDSPDEKILIELATGETLKTDMFLFAAGRSGNVKDLNLDKVGVEVGTREMIPVNEDYQTNIPHIFAAGDVIGFPSLASTSMDQGRVAVSHIFDIGDLEHLSDVFPYGIYTIPEVSMVGITEEDAIKKKLDFCVGRASYKHMPRGKIMGAREGFLKIVFDRESLVILGVHIIGYIASEIIHYGMALVKNEKKISEVIADVFNFPTLHDLYKYACYDGLGNLAGHTVKRFDQELE